MENWEGLGKVMEFWKAQKSIGSYADILLAHHAIVGEERLRDEPRECLCRRLQKQANSVNSTNVENIWYKRPFYIFWCNIPWKLLLQNF